MTQHLQPLTKQSHDDSLAMAKLNP